MQSETIGKLAEAIAKAQAELKPAKKDTINPFFGKKYADLANVMESLRPFAAHGIAITQIPYVPQREGMVGVTTQLTHTSGEWIRGDMEMPVMKDDPQGFGSAFSYLRRYSVSCMTASVADEDDDGNAASHPPTPAKTYTAQKAAASKKIAELRTTEAAAPPVTESEASWNRFLDYMGDDPHRTTVGKNLKLTLGIATVAELKAGARIAFIEQFQQACKAACVPCEWVNS